MPLTHRCRREEEVADVVVVVLTTLICLKPHFA